MTTTPSVSRTLSTLSAESGSKTGKGQDDAAICLLSVEHLQRHLFYAVSGFHQKCGRPTSKPTNEGIILDEPFYPIGHPFGKPNLIQSGFLTGPDSSPLLPLPEGELVLVA